MPPGAATSSFEYCVFTIAVDDAGAVNVPVGVALWSRDAQWHGTRFVDRNEKLERFRASDHLAYVKLVEEKLSGWIDSSHLPYAEHDLQPYETKWWTHVRELLVHRVRASEPRPVDCDNPEQELEPLFDAVLSPFRAVRDQRARINGEIKRCLNGLSDKFRRRQEFVGFGGRPVRVMHVFEGPSGRVAVEGVNLATSQAEQQSDAIVSKLMRLLEGGERFDIIVGYLTSPGGLNGEQVLVDWIQRQTGAKTFDLQRQRKEFRQTAEESVVKASMAIQ